LEIKERVGWFETIFRSIGDAIIVTDNECIKLLNPVAEVTELETGRCPR